jgi:hypothetical protein
MSRECLARRGLHIHVALRSYASLIRKVERRELRHAVAGVKAGATGKSGHCDLGVLMFWTKLPTYVLSQ